MLVSELITKERIRERVFDTLSATFTDNELLAYINDAINLVWNELTALGYYETVGDKQFTLASDTLPTDFLRFAAKYPIITKADGTATLYGTLPCDTRYLRRPIFMTATSDTLPFKNDSINLLLGQITIMLALNRNEYNVEFEQGIISQLIKLIG